jgi:integrase
LGGNVKGEAVRSGDPDKGPLTALEVAELATALRAAYAERTLPIEQQASIWLALAFGANAGQYALLRETDVAPQFIDGQLVTTLVSVPKHKKRHSYARSEFASRKANRFVGRVLRDLIESNSASHPANGSNSPRPLFWRASPRSDGPGREEWEWHLTAPQFTSLLREAIDNLCVKGRTGKALNISTRRLRYTLASRMVDAGASPYALAAALDHSDLQNIGIYFDVRSDIVEHLDKAMAMALSERALKFAQVVEREEDAVNGCQKGSRRYFDDRSKRVHEPIGTCGHTSFCNVAAPYACYTCPKFQAWMDGPHELVLDHLIESRTRREQMGLDPKILGFEDPLIIHVAEVIKRIAEMKDDGGKGDE